MFVIAASSDGVLASKTPTNATPLQWHARCDEMFVTAASADGVLASKKPTNSMPLEWDACSGETSRSATFADWELAAKEQINPMPLHSEMRRYGISRPLADRSPRFNLMNERRFSANSGRSSLTTNPDVEEWVSIKSCE
jgi:hypothetical protein